MRFNDRSSPKNRACGVAHRARVSYFFHNQPPRNFDIIAGPRLSRTQLQTAADGGVQHAVWGGSNNLRWFAPPSWSTPSPRSGGSTAPTRNTLSPKCELKCATFADRLTATSLYFMDQTDAESIDMNICLQTAPKMTFSAARRRRAAEKNDFWARFRIFAIPVLATPGGGGVSRMVIILSLRTPFL